MISRYLRHTFRGVSPRLYRRSITTGNLLLFPRRTRLTKEISDEEVQKYTQHHQQYQGQNNNYYPGGRTGNFGNDSYGGYPTYSTGSHIPPNENGLITPEDGIYDILKEPTIVIERQIEMMNVFMGFEQANRYKIMNANGDQIGYMEEKDIGFLKMLGRQFFRLHRPFDIDVFNNYGELLLTIKRPFSFINSHIKALLPGYDSYGNLMFETIGESRQSWHLWRRRYNLFKLEDEVADEYEQYGAIDAPFLSFEFLVRNREGDTIGAVDRNWVGLGREFFTDSGVYIIRMDPSSFEGMGDYYRSISGPLTLDQRAVLLGNAVSIDFDYFSRNSNSGGLFSMFSPTDVE